MTAAMPTHDEEQHQKELAERRAEAQRRGEATWALLQKKIGAACRERGAARVDEVERRVGLLYTMMVNALPSGADRTQWDIRATALAALRNSLSNYLALIPPGATHEDRTWFLSAEAAAKEMLRWIEKEETWRGEMERDPARIGRSLETLWFPRVRDGRKGTHRTIVRSAIEWGLNATDVAYLESVGHLRIETIDGADRPAPLGDWDPGRRGDTLYLVEGKNARFNDVLRDSAIRKRWADNFRLAQRAKNAR